MYVLKTAGITTKKRIHEFKTVMRSRQNEKKNPEESGKEKTVIRQIENSIIYQASINPQNNIAILIVHKIGFKIKQKTRVKGGWLHNNKMFHLLRGT